MLLDEMAGIMIETEVIDIKMSPARETRQFYDILEEKPDVLKSLVGLSTYTRRRINKAMDSTNAEQRYYMTTGYGLFNLATPPYNLDELAHFYDTSPINHGAINAKVADAIGIGYGFRQTPAAAEALQNLSEKSRLDKAQKKIERAKNQVDEWINSLNDSDSFQTILEKLGVDYQTFGNAYLEVGRTITGEIGYVGHIPASTIRRRLQKDGYLQIIGNVVTYFRNFGETNPSPLTNDPNPNELIHISKYSPKNTFYGVPDSIACASAIVGDALAAKYNLDYFENAATPRHIVTLTGGRLSASAEEKLFRFLQTSLKGNPHRSLFVPLPLTPDGQPVKLEMHQVDNKTNDASFEEYRKRNREDILVAHGVPESRIGGGSSGGNAESINADRMFKEQIVVPMQNVFNKAINRIVKEKTNLVEFVLNELTLIDEVAQSEIDERYLRNRVIKPNEVRPRLNLPSVPEGEEFIEINAKIKAEQNAQANGTRTRDQERSAKSSDSTSSVTGRNPAGAGRKQN